MSPNCHAFDGSFHEMKVTQKRLMSEDFMNYGRETGPLGNSDWELWRTRPTQQLKTLRSVAPHFAQRNYEQALNYILQRED